MTWACLRYVQGLANIFGPQNCTQGHCDVFIIEIQALRTRSCVLRIFYKEHKQLASS